MAIGPRILYIEDNPENRLLVQRILLAEGFEFLTAESGAAGIALADKERPDLILVDINLPELGLSGVRCSSARSRRGAPRRIVA